MPSAAGRFPTATRFRLSRYPQRAFGTEYVTPISISSVNSSLVKVQYRLQPSTTEQWGGVRYRRSIRSRMRTVPLNDHGRLLQHQLLRMVRQRSE